MTIKQRHLSWFTQQLLSFTAERSADVSHAWLEAVLEVIAKEIA